MLRIAIVEDVPTEAEKLKSYVQKYLSTLGKQYAIACFTDGKELVEHYQAAYDLIFLDIEMQDMDGMTAARQIRQVDQHTLLVFVTRMAQFAVKGYEVGAVDFILKPLDYFTFSFKMQKVMNYLSLRKDVKVIVKNGGEIYALPSREIRYIEVLNHELIIHTKSGEYQLRGSLNEMERKLTPVGFKRCSKSYLLNMAYISSIEGNRILMGEEEIPLSRSMRKELICALADYYGGKV